jgi:nitrogen fixation/metabolism regulation signal transduction histidine kinase
MGEHQETEPDTLDTSKGHNPTPFSGFDLSVSSIIRFLPIGIIIFNPDLKIVEANPLAAELIQLETYIDKSLAKGTDDKIWQDWTKNLKEVISTGKTYRFDEVEYTSNSKTKLLKVFCTALQKTNTSENLGGIITIEDITEKTNLQNKLTCTERLATVGKLASKVAH